MSDYGYVTIVRVQEGDVVYAVVERADDVIGISFELLEELTSGTEDIVGAMEFDADDPDLIHFGAPGRGLGRLTYRIHERRDIAGVAVARRIR